MSKPLVINLGYCMNAAGNPTVSAADIQHLSKAAEAMASTSSRPSRCQAAPASTSRGGFEVLALKEALLAARELATLVKQVTTSTLGVVKVTE